MGKPIEDVKPDDTLVIGVTNRLPNSDNRLLFMETDTKEDFKNIRYYLIQNEPYITYAIFKTKKGYHFVIFNSYPRKYVEEFLFEHREHLDKYHVGYSIAKGFSTLRLSKRKSRGDEIKCVDFYLGVNAISRPHFELYKPFILKLLNRGKTKNNRDPLVTIVFRGPTYILTKDINRRTPYFDEGYELIGYVIDKKKKKKTKVGMIIDAKGIRTISQES